MANANGLHFVNRDSLSFNGTLTSVPKPFLIGVCGGTSSGKVSVCERIMEQLGEVELDRVNIISLDSFYRDLTEDEKKLADRGQFNFDHPDVLNSTTIIECIKEIKKGKTVQVPVYDYHTHSSKNRSFKTIYPADVVLFEGILVFYFKEVRECFDMKLFVDTDPDTRLARRVLRDTLEYGRDLEKVLHNYTSFVKPAFEDYCLPTKKYADVIIPRGADNTVAIDLIGQHIKDILKGNAISNPNNPRRRIRTTSENSAIVFLPVKMLNVIKGQYSVNGY